MSVGLYLRGTTYISNKIQQEAINAPNPSKNPMNSHTRAPEETLKFVVSYNNITGYPWPVHSQAMGKLANNMPLVF